MDRVNLKSLVETAPPDVMVYSVALQWYLAAKMGRDVTAQEIAQACHDAGRVVWHDFDSLVESI